MFSLLVIYYVSHKFNRKLGKFYISFIKDLFIY